MGKEDSRRARELMRRARSARRGGREGGAELALPRHAVLITRRAPFSPPPQGTPASTYCVIEATNSHQMYKTHIVPSNLHPVWNESYQVGHARTRDGIYVA